MTEAEKKAKKKYAKEKVKGVSLQFYPKEYELLEKLKKRAEAFGGINAYIKGLVEEDLKEGGDDK